jgi:hypothetical protein
MMMMNDVKAKCHAHSTINQTNNQRIKQTNQSNLNSQNSTFKTQRSQSQQPQIRVCAISISVCACAHSFHRPLSPSAVPRQDCRKCLT